MKLLRVALDNLAMFEDGRLELDLFARDRVVAEDESVTELGKPVYSLNVVALAGINASGKSTALSLLDLALRAASGQPIAASGCDRGLARVFCGTTHLDALIWSGGRMHLLRSEIRVGGTSLDAAPGASGLAFGEEVVYNLPERGMSKKQLSAPFDEIAGLGVEEMRRSRLPEGETRFLKPDVSVFSAVVDTPAAHLHLEAADMPLSLLDGVGGVDETLRAFDAGIEHLEVADDGRAFRLKMLNRDESLTLSREGLEDVLSSGTAKGLMIVQRAVLVLKSGGYLLLDEIENHLNRQLVAAIVGLFCTRRTNPLGATLVFTTHYPEVLDALHRKDCVYFLKRGAGSRSEAVKYSSEVRRIENKKSEVFSSNYLGGTAPRYTDVAALLSFAASAIGGEGRD